MTGLRNAVLDVQRAVHDLQQKLMTRPINTSGSWMAIRVAMNEVSHQAAIGRRLPAEISAAITSLTEASDEFLFWWDRLGNEFLLGSHDCSVLASNHRDLPPWILAKEIQIVMDMTSVPAGVMRSPRGRQAKGCWYGKASKAYKQDILAQVDAFLERTSNKFDFTDDVKDRDDIQRLAVELNRILVESKKSCHFSYPKKGDLAYRLVLLHGAPKARKPNTRKKMGRKTPSKHRQEIVKKSTKRKGV